MFLSSSLKQPLRGFLLLVSTWLTVHTGIVAADAVKANQQFDGLIREPLMLSVTLPDGKPALLDAFVTRPAGKVRWPVALITNGADGTAELDRWELNPNWMSGTALAFARHGYAAVVVLRQGYGYSSGGAEYAGGTCTHPLHDMAMKRDADDLLGALSAIRQQPWASRHKTVLAGMSAGGFAVLAAGAGHPSGVQAIVNFDGGRGASTGSTLCDEPGLLRAFATMGSSSRTPTLWLYSENDKIFPPVTGKSFFSAYTSAGGKGSFIVMPPFGTNGHYFMNTAPEEFWWKTVADFLHKNGLHYKTQVAISLKKIPLPEVLHNTEAISAFEKYESSQIYEKAFATDATGAWGVSYHGRTTSEAAVMALNLCQNHKKLAKETCTIYAINNTVISH